MVHLKRGIDDSNADARLSKTYVPGLKTAEQRVMPLVRDAGVVRGELPLFEHVQFGELHLRPPPKRLNRLPFAQRFDPQGAHVRLEAESDENRFRIEEHDFTRLDLQPAEPALLIVQVRERVRSEEPTSE